METLLHSRWTRPLAAAGAVVAAAGVLLLAHADARDRDALVALAAELGLRGKPYVEVRTAIRRESDPAERRIALARALFAARPAVGSDDAERRQAKLAATERLALEALVDLPASWEASSLLGSARFESRRLRRDTRLFSEATDWELPLFAAVSRAGGSTLVERLLAAAYLEVWPAIAPARRPQAAASLVRAFGDRRFNVMYFDDWVRVAGSFEAAAELLPPTAETSRRLATIAVRDGDTDQAVRLYAEERQRLRVEIAGIVEHALTRDEPDRSWTLAQAILRAPLGTDFVPAVERAVIAYERNETAIGLPAAAARWVEWAEPLCLTADCPISPATIERLAAAAGALVGSPSAAFAALAAGKSAKAEQIARRANALSDEAWVPYRLLLATQQLAAGDASAAGAQLATIHPSALRSPVYHRLVRELRRRRLMAGEDDPKGLLRRETWVAGEWRGLEPSNELEIGVARTASALRLSFRRPSWRNFLLLVEIDGRVATPVLVARRATGVVVPLAITPGVHLLRVRAHEGDILPLGDARLE